MSTTVTWHPDPDTLSAFALGRLPIVQWNDVEKHVVECPTCCKQLDRIGADSFLGLAQQAALATPNPAGGETLRTEPEIPAPLLDHPRYKVVKVLGAGGMGVVYKAEHRMMGRVVALKVLNSKHIEKPGAIDRFRREVRLASRLNHPNIVTAHDADEAGGLHFLVMEFVEGASLDRLVSKRGPLPVATAAHIARHIALGLQHAFEKGMVHRDIKPHNIMVNKRGQVKILDFGLACVSRGDAGVSTEATTEAQMTAPEIVLGTPDFLAPEQARTGASVDHRADLYGLGCTLYFLLTGRPPFDGATPFEKLIAHLEEPPPDAALLRRDVPPGLASLVMKLMAKDPEERFQQPSEVAAALVPYAKGLGGDSIPAPVVAQVLDAEPLAFEENNRGETLPDTVAITPGSMPVPKRRKGKSKNAEWGPYLPYGIGAMLVGIVVVVGALIYSKFVRTDPPAAVASDSTKTRPTVPKWEVGKSEFAKAKGDPGTAVPPKTAPPTTPPTAALPDGPKVVIVLPPRGIYKPDYEDVRRGLEAGGMTVRTAAPTLNPVNMMPITPGDPVKPDFRLSELNGAEWSAVVFIGAGVEDYLPGGSSESVAKRLIEEARDNKKIVGAICLGVKVLGENGYLDGKFAAKPDLYRNPPSSVRWRGPFATVVEDGVYVTASSAQDAEKFSYGLLFKIRKSP